MARIQPPWWHDRPGSLRCYGPFLRAYVRTPSPRWKPIGWYCNNCRELLLD